MRIVANSAEVWTFCRTPEGVRYLLLEASQEKADKHFGGNRFWQVPDAALNSDDGATVEVLRRFLVGLELEPVSLWAIEHISTIYNRRFDAIQIVPAFAAEVTGLPSPAIDNRVLPDGRIPSFEYGEFEWADERRVQSLLTFRGLLDGFAQLRRFITECPEPRGEFRLG